MLWGNCTSVNLERDNSKRTAVTDRYHFHIFPLTSCPPVVLKSTELIYGLSFWVLLPDFELGHISVKISVRMK